MRDDEDEDYRPQRKRQRGGVDIVDALLLMFMVLMTILIPLIGIIFGCIGLASGNSRKRAQGMALLVVGIVATVGWVITWQQR